MSCQRCGANAQGELCADCAQMDRVERNHEHQTDGGAATVEAEPTESDDREFDQIAFGELHRHDKARDIRAETVEEIQERIDTSDYNPAKPLRVFEDADGYVIADGNHRYKALEELGVSDAFTVPCVIEPEYDPTYAQIVSVATKSNRDEDVLAEDDLFDDLDRIGYLREAGHTQAEIGEKLGWSRSKVSQYTTLLSNVATQVLEIGRSHQNGRVADSATSVAKFSEGWFRKSNLYDLNRDGVDSWDGTHAQMRVMRWFVDDQNCDATKSAVQRQVEDIKQICEQLETLEAELNPGVDDAERAELRDEITAGTYTDETLAGAIENANHSAKDRAEFGTDALDGLRSLEDNSVDCVVTDPPYGVEYESHRDTDRESFPDEEADTFALLDDVFAELERVCKANAHVYVFFSMNRIESVREVAGEHFDVTPAPLIWAKRNHAPTRDAERGFEKMYAHQYEPILMCRLENGDSRRLNGGRCSRS
jgi:hypothetical protein